MWPIITIHDITFGEVAPIDAGASPYPATWNNYFIYKNNHKIFFKKFNTYLNFGK